MYLAQLSATQPSHRPRNRRLLKQKWKRLHGSLDAANRHWPSCLLIVRYKACLVAGYSQKWRSSQASLVDLFWVHRQLRPAHIGEAQEGLNALCQWECTIGVRLSRKGVSRGRQRKI